MIVRSFVFLNKKLIVSRHHVINQSLDFLINCRLYRLIDNATNVRQMSNVSIDVDRIFFLLYKKLTRHFLKICVQFI